MIEKPQTYEESEMTAAQQVAAWHRATRLHENLWLAWRQAWCVSSLAAEVAAKEGSQLNGPPVDAEAACLAQVTDVVEPSGQPAPEIAKTKAPPVPAAAPVCVPLPPGTGVRFDGLYQAEPAAENLGSQHPWLSYWRFYTDGSVLVAASDGAPEKVAGWLNKSHKEQQPACATAKSGMLQIVRTLPAGKIEYAGSVKSSDLVLHVVNGINGRQSNEVYHFVPVHFEEAAEK
jgi:hypothetical protein